MSSEFSRNKVVDEILTRLCQNDPTTSAYCQL